MTSIVGFRKYLAEAVAVLCIAGGVVGSILGARAIANSDSSSARQTSAQSAAAAASNVKQALQREEELLVSSSTFFTGDPKATHTEFAIWAHWARMLHRYPELDQLGLVTIMHALELHARKARLIPAGVRPFYCLASADLVRTGVSATPAGLDYCAVIAGMLQSRDSASALYVPVSVAHKAALEVLAPIFKENEPPATVGGRMAAFVGWARAVLAPEVVLAQALQSHPGDSLRLSYNASAVGAANVVVSAGPAPAAGVPGTTIVTRDGFTIQSFGAPTGTTALDDSDALALLIVGFALSAVLGVLVLTFGGEPTGAPAAQPTHNEDPAPEEALYDPLTSLPNRALMLDRATCMLARASRQSGLLVGALFIDIDWFADINQRLGEAAGDRVLKIVAERLEAVVRAGDTVGRLGSDEFVILVETAARGARLDALARRVVESLHRPFELNESEDALALTASIGVAFGRYATPEDLLRDAQLALYAAKSAGKDRYTLFNANMRSVIEGQGVLEVELNAALAASSPEGETQFFVLYEPIFDLRSGQVAGVDALLRWLHPQQGVLEPSAFLPLAEETGLSVPIGRFLLEEACGRAAAWNVAGHHVGVSVEVSANQLNRDGFIIDVRRALQQSGIEPAMLTLAIAETTVMRDVSTAVEQLAELKQLGVRIAIDDFGGSGYAYHSDLRRLPLDFLKVDSGSLAASEDEDYRTWLLEAIMIVGRDLSLEVIAKGIESDERLSALQAMGCAMAQGELIGKPVPADALETLFSASVPVVAGAGAGAGAANSSQTSSPAAENGRDEFDN